MSLIGSLEDLGLGDILQIIHLSQKSGVLSIRAEAGEGFSQKFPIRRGWKHCTALGRATLLAGNHAQYNHGADFGRVLAAFEVPEAEREAFAAFLKNLGYPYLPEPDNQAYRLFLG